MQIEVFARTERGCVRESNEDHFGFVDLGTPGRRLDPSGRGFVVGRHGVVMVVCDGMGGTGHGKLASSLALEAFSRAVKTSDQAAAAAVDLEIRGQVMSEGVERAEAAIQADISRAPDHKGMGTTLTAVWMTPAGFTLVHVGDSRAYTVGAAGLRQISEDHCVTGQLVAAGRLTHEEARNYPHHDALLQAVGRGVALAPQVVSGVLAPGDAILLCSDGLTKVLRDDEIAAIISEHGVAVRCCRALTERVCALGGQDNVTVALMRHLTERP